MNHLFGPPNQTTTKITNFHIFGKPKPWVTQSSAQLAPILPPVIENFDQTWYWCFSQTCKEFWQTKGMNGFRKSKIKGKGVWSGLGWLEHNQLKENLFGAIIDVGWPIPACLAMSHHDYLVIGQILNGLCLGPVLVAYMARKLLNWWMWVNSFHKCRLWYARVLELFGYFPIVLYLACFSHICMLAFVSLIDKN